MTVAPAQDGDTSVSRGRIAVYEKGASGGTHSWTECGMLALEKRLLFEHDSTDESGFYSWLARTGQVAALIDERQWLEVGDLQGYEEFCAVVAAGQLPRSSAAPDA